MPPEATMLISEMSPSQIWSKYIRYIGAGAVTFGGIITLIKTLPTIIGAFKDSFNDLKNRDKSQSAEKLRTDKDFPLVLVVFGSIALVLLMTILPNLPVNFLAAVMIVIFGFFFVTVASRIVGLIGSSSSPVSGMTIATLMATSLIFIGIGWTGDYYQPIALVVGSIVCIAASNAGATSQDLKTGFLVGATPIKQQIGLLIGVSASTIAVGFTLLLLNDTLGIGAVTEAHPNPLPAPQATLMATVIKGLLSQNLPWGLVLAGMGLSAVVELCGVSSLAFAVGAYLPLSTTSPIFIGGAIKMIADRVSNRSGEEGEVSSGALFSSGLIAGGSLTGILVAVLLGTNVSTSDGTKSVIAIVHDAVRTVIPEGGDLIAIAMFSLLAYIVFRVARTKIS